MATSYRAEAAALAMLAGANPAGPTLRTHIVFGGTSQSTQNLRREGDWGFEMALPPIMAPIVGRVGRTENTGGGVSTWGDFSAAPPIVRTVLGNNDTATQFDADSVGCVIAPTTRLTFTADLAVNTPLGNGAVLQGGVITGFFRTAEMRTGGAAGTQPRSWFARDMRSKVVVLNTPGAIPVSYLTRVMTASGTSRFQTPITDSTGVTLTPTGTGNASNPFTSGPWTPIVTDPNYADRDIRCVVFSGAADESVAGSHFTPVACVFEAMEGGQRPKGVVLNFIGRSSTDTAERLNLVSEAALTSFYRETIDDDVDVIVIWEDGEHNVNAAHTTGGLFNANYATAVQASMRRHLNAARAAKPGKRVHVGRRILWPVPAGVAGMDSRAMIDSCEQRVREACDAVGPEAFYVNVAQVLNYAMPSQDDIHLVNGSASAETWAQQSTRSQRVAALTVQELMRVAAAARSPRGLLRPRSRTRN